MQALAFDEACTCESSCCNADKALLPEYSSDRSRASSSMGRNSIYGPEVHGAIPR